jgi:hypothetical protein
MSFLHLPKSALPFILLLLALPAGAVESPTKPDVPRGHDLGAAADGIAGLVVNQTLTNAGYDFYRIFSILWSEKADSGKYSLSVQERLSKRFGNQVGIFLGQRRVFFTPLPQRYDGLKSLGEKAVEEVQANILTLSIMSDDEDILKDEL